MRCVGLLICSGFFFFKVFNFCALKRCKIIFTYLSCIFMNFYILRYKYTLGLIISVTKSKKSFYLLLSSPEPTWLGSPVSQYLFLLVVCLSVCLLSLCLSFKSLIAYQLKLIFIPFNFIFIELNYCVYWIITLVV